MSNTKFNLLAEEIGTHAMVRLCRAFLIENRNTLSLRCELTADEALDPMNCPLHSKKMTGSLCYSPTENGEHPAFAPPCHGCSIGITEAAHEGVTAAEEEYGQEEEGDAPEGLEEEENFLPVGAHLLPEEFKEVLRRLHMDVQEKVGVWFNRANTNTFKKLYPAASLQHIKDIREMSAKYPEALDACKAFQAEKMTTGDAMRINGYVPEDVIRSTCFLPCECNCDSCVSKEGERIAQLEFAQAEIAAGMETKEYALGTPLPTPTTYLNFSYFN